LSNLEQQIKMNFKQTLFLTVIATLVLSCTTDSTSDLINAEPIPEQVLFAKDVKSIIDNNCVVCHGATPIPGTNLSLTTYDKVRDAVLNKGLITRITLEEGNSSLMPQGGPKLPAGTISIVTKWQEDGLQQ
jgi:uncharacterized membrane protein